MLHYDTECKSSLGLPHGFAPDDTGFYDSTDPGNNSGFGTRRMMFASTVTADGNVHFDANNSVTLLGKLVT